ncbi:four helix bundle protein [Aliifodinibius sp. S!AR15-10]|uniref:four helix bundle protein n=1 Tax=Aliifodinibius sp. S!AR15-10 TaxID=2950437 RepID=UPI002860ADBA|nr:four helix bundle protein [Aliifodinibius sp. S!AR15-10]MDR8393503.1 four helix bundle protein [Aliifodinibius sp. S!AR15-10]
MATIKKFEDLEIWQESRILVNKIYELTRQGEFDKDFGLKDQVRRSTVSVMNNISEGFESRTVKRFIDYLGRSKASCGETRSMLYVALDCKYMTDEQFDECYNLATKISRKIYRFTKYLEKYKSNDRVSEAVTSYKTDLQPDE